MLSQEMKDNIRRHYGTSDEDLKDLGEVMDALGDLDKLEEIKGELETYKLEAEQKMKDLDNSWRTRYRERFFDGEVAIGDYIDELDKDDSDDISDITIEDYLEDIKKERY